MEQDPGIRPLAQRRASSGGIRVLAQALQMFDDQPPRNRMEFTVFRKLADEMRQVVRQPTSTGQVARLAAEFPVVETLLDDFLMTMRIVRDRAGNYAVLDGLMLRMGTR